MQFFIDMVDFGMTVSPQQAPDAAETVRVDFPRYGRHADELCVTEAASVIWALTS